MVDNCLKRSKLLERQNWRCCWCGESLSLADATLEHLLPDVMGGTQAYENTAVAHGECNNARGHNVWQDPHPSFLFDFVRQRLATIREDVEMHRKLYGYQPMRWTLEKTFG